MALDSMKEIFERSARENIPFWEIVLQYDMEERQVSRQASMAKMLSTWQAIQDAADSYTGTQRSVSGLVGGDGLKMRLYARRGESIGGEFMDEVIVQAISMAESNACMRRIVAAPTAGSCGVVPAVLLPLAHGLGINMGLMCGAIISGAIFGDNLAPISDTTISSALTQEADISQVVRTRFPYAAISGAVAAVLFAVVGLTQDANIPADLELDGSTAKSLFLLVLPVLMVILMRKGWDLMGTLILCNLSGIVLNLVLGTIAPAKMFANDGPIVAGMSGMMTLVLYVTLLFQLLEILNSSGAFDGLTVSLMKHCKSPRSGELICYLVAALGSVVTGGSGIAIVFFGSLVRRITKAFHIDRCRGANILDGVACGATGLMPHGNPTLVSLGVALAIDGVDPNFSFLDIIPYNFHCWGLMLIFLLSILTGIGRRFEKPEETANA